MTKSDILTTEHTEDTEKTSGTTLAPQPHRRMVAPGGIFSVISVHSVVKGSLEK